MLALRQLLLIASLLLHFGLGGSWANAADPFGGTAAGAPSARVSAQTPSLENAEAAAQSLAEQLRERESAFLMLKGRLSTEGRKASAELKQEVRQAELAFKDQAVALRAAARYVEDLGGDGEAFKGQANAALGEAAPGEAPGSWLSVKGLVQLIEAWTLRAYKFVIDQGPMILWQALVVVVLWTLFGILARFVKRMVRKGLASPRVQASSLVKDFIAGIASNAVVIAGLLVILNQMGLEVGPLLAGFGVAGFIAGFALQDVLSNFAAGVMILFYRPFDVGDFVRAGGESGTVREMSLVSTILTTPDNQRLIVPNKKIWGETIQNVTSSPTRRVDLTIAIDYADDIAKALAVLERVVKAHAQVLTDPETVIRVHKLADSGVEIVVRPWVNTADYWTVYWDLTRSIKETFDREGLTIPFPQRVVHVKGGELA
jgi:small conductance mechanosensitive channel